MPICPDRQSGVRTIKTKGGRRRGAHPGDVVDDAVDDLALEGLEHDGAIAGDELGLAVSRDDHTLADVRDGDDGDDEAELAGASALDVRVELRLKVLLHARPEVGRVQHDRVRELFLQAERRVGSWRLVSVRVREGGQGSYDEEHRPSRCSRVVVAAESPARKRVNCRRPRAS